MITVRNLDLIRKQNPYLYEALYDIQQQTLDVNIASPPAIGSLTVSAASGVFTGTIVDNAEHTLGISYFVEYSTDQNFANPLPIRKSLGPDRNFTLAIGNQTLYWRAYSQYAPPYINAPSLPVNYGNPPTAVVGGAFAGNGPAIPPSGGGGTNPPNAPGGGGFGTPAPVVPSGKGPRLQQ